MMNEFVDLGFRERQKRQARACLEMGCMSLDRHEGGRKFPMNGRLRLYH
jgi:hypothetical protein